MTTYIFNIVTLLGGLAIGLTQKFDHKVLEQVVDALVREIKSRHSAVCGMVCVLWNTVSFWKIC